MGGQNFTEEHFILLCVDVHAQGQGMTANNSPKVQGQMCSGEINCSQQSCAWEDLLCLTLLLPGGWSPGVCHKHSRS